MTTIDSTVQLADEVLALSEAQRDWDAMERLRPALRSWRLADPLGWPDRPSSPALQAPEPCGH